MIDDANEKALWSELCASFTAASQRYAVQSQDPTAPERIIGLLVETTARTLVSLSYEKKFAQDFVQAIFNAAWDECASRRHN